MGRRTSDAFWMNVFVGFRELAQLIRQERTREEYELHDKWALNCEIRKQWEKHFNEWPHNRMTRCDPTSTETTSEAKLKMLGSLVPFQNLEPPLFDHLRTRLNPE